jgi:glycosyltransferase involved in cell wall biosynthesis
MTSIFYWIDHLAYYPGNSGVQRVTRHLARAMELAGRNLVYVEWDGEYYAPRRATPAALANLAKFGGPTRGAPHASGPLHLNGVDGSDLAGAWMLVPEVTHHHPDQTAHLIDYCRSQKMKVAFIFYDLIPIKLDGYEDIREAHRRYAQQLAAADLILAISEYSAQALKDYYLNELQLSPASIPQIVAAPLGEAHGDDERVVRGPAGGDIAQIVTFGTIEPRKNQIGLLRAFNRLTERRPGLKVRLSVVGHLHPAVAQEARALIEANPNIDYYAYASDEDVASLLARARFSIFPSIEEGYGLPIIESLHQGCPVICAKFGAMREVAEGGGCVLIDTRSEHEIEHALERLLLDDDQVAALHAEIAARTFSPWAEYAAQVERLMANYVGLRRVYMWADLIVDQNFSTGVQRVVRSLARSLQQLGVEIYYVRWDQSINDLRALTADEQRHLARWNGPEYVAPRPYEEPQRGEWIILPELMIPMNPPDGSLIDRLHKKGFRVASIFYDLIPYKMADLYPAATRDYFAGYWSVISRSDAILPISHAVGDDLVAYYKNRLTELNNLHVRVRPVPLAGELLEFPRVTAARPHERRGLNLLMVGTREPRKNHLLFLEAVQNARAHGADIYVTIAGRSGAFPDLDEKLQELAAREDWITLLEHVDDAALAHLYAAADMGAYASFEEGFGLPVIESLWAGRPSLCHNDGAIAEVAEGGGCFQTDMRDPGAISEALQRLAADPALVVSLGEDARRRPIKTWDAYGREIIAVLAELGMRTDYQVRALPGWAPRPVAAWDGPILSLCVTTYNRAKWLKHTLPQLLELVRTYRDVVEVVVCDNASTDDSEPVLKSLNARGEFTYFRNAANVGMLGNLGVTARHARGKYIWLLGDDDILIPGVIEDVLSGILDHPDVEMVYLNYAYTHFDDPEALANPRDVIAASTPVAAGGPNRYVARLRGVAALNENLFTAIYACVFRRDHAIRAYTLDVSGEPFTTLRTCVPSTVYSMTMLLDRPAYWVGEPAIVVNMNVSWREWVLLWHLERMPELYDWAELAGLDVEKISIYRWNHAQGGADHVRQIYAASEALRAHFDIERFLERSKRLERFRAEVVPALAEAYENAWREGRTPHGAPPPDQLFERVGLSRSAECRSPAKP